MVCMVEVDKLVVIGTIAAGVVYEVNNLLVYVMLNFEFFFCELFKFVEDLS